MLIGPLYGLHNITLPRFRAISYSAPSRSIYEDRSAHDTSPAGPTVSTSASTAGRECMVSLAVARYLSNASPRACNYGFSCVTVNPHARYILFSSRSHLFKSLITASLPFTLCQCLSPGVAQSGSQGSGQSHRTEGLACAHAPPEYDIAVQSPRAFGSA